MYYIFVQNGKLNGAGQCPCLNEDVKNIEVSEDTFNDYLADKTKYIYNNGSIELNPNYEDEKALIEHARIQELSMTRSDFFDGTIKAFGLNEQLLTPIISRVLDIVWVDNITKLVALNNFENALNFYRKHTLFTLLANIDLPLGSNGESIRITSEQFDKFFDETDKKNPEAYKELLPSIENIGEQWNAM